jgi:hypothetical protein
MLLLRGIRKPAARTFIRCRNLASVVPPLELRVHNSLTGTKEALPPLPEGQSHWGWYACGPTVYDDAHIGHARTYVCFDMIRRVRAKCKISIVGQQQDFHVQSLLVYLSVVGSPMQQF